MGIRNDGMTIDGCKAAIDAAHRSEDTFWHSNLLSGAKLRKHYEKLRIKVTATRSQQMGPVHIEDTDTLPW